MKRVTVLNGVVLSGFREARTDDKTNKTWPAKVSVDFLGGTFANLNIVCKPEELIIGKSCIVTLEEESQFAKYVNAYHQEKESFAFFPVAVISCKPADGK